MFRVFKGEKMSWKLKFVMIFVLFFGQKVLAETEPVLNPKSLFDHELETTDEIDSAVFVDGDLTIKVYRLDEKDPESTRFNYDVYFKCEGGEIKHLDRKIQGAPVQKFCELAEPEILQDEPEIGPGRYLVLPGFSYDDRNLTCKDEMKVEFHYLDEMRELCF